MRRSSLDTIDVGIDRELSSQFDAVKLVAGSIDDVEVVATSVDDVNTVSQNITSVITSSNNIADINVVAADLSLAGVSLIETVSNNIDEVVLVGNSINAVGINAINIVAINTNANNIIDIQNASENAASALSAANIATIKAGEASSSAITASAQAGSAATKAGEANASAASALVSQNAASVSADNALISANNADASEANALASANSASNSASVATTKASEANASTISASNSAADALVSKNSASISATTATTKAAEAVVSASSAAGSASVATTKANEASLSADSALASENKAEKWATENEDIEVEVGEYSAKHWAMKAQGFAEGDATNIGYDSTSSGLVSTNVQAAIDEIVVNTAGIHDAANITTGTLDDARLPNTISSNITGNAATAAKWSSSRTITLSGDVTGSVSIDGSANATITTTVAANSVALGTDTTGNYVAGVTQGTGISVTGTAGEGWSPTVSLTNVGIAGTYRSVTTDAQGRVISGTNPTTVADYGLTDVYTKTEVHTVLPKVGFDTTNVTVPSAGQMAWNIDEATVDIGLNGGVLQVGQEQLVRVRNNTGSTIVNGTAVMATGTLGNSGRIAVAPANLTNTNAKMILGVCTESIAAGADGFVTTFGKVRNLRTTGSQYGETWVDGDVIYVKDSGNGALTKVVPSDTQLKMPIAIVINAHATTGTLFVRVNSIDENHAKSELAVKADTTYVDGLIGDISTALDTINGEII